jgi:hypothetical protein
MSKTTTGAAAKWEQLWSDHLQAKNEGRDTTETKKAIREWHQAKGWRVPSWAE